MMTLRLPRLPCWLILHVASWRALGIVTNGNSREGQNGRVIRAEQHRLAPIVSTAVNALGQSTPWAPTHSIDGDRHVASRPHEVIHLGVDSMAGVSHSHSHSSRELKYTGRLTTTAPPFLQIPSQLVASQADLKPDNDTNASADGGGNFSDDTTPKPDIPDAAGSDAGGNQSASGDNTSAASPAPSPVPDQPEFQNVPADTDNSTEEGQAPAREIADWDAVQGADVQSDGSLWANNVSCFGSTGARGILDQQIGEHMTDYFAFDFTVTGDGQLVGGFCNSTYTTGLDGVYYGMYPGGLGQDKLVFIIEEGELVDAQSTYVNTSAWDTYDEGDVFELRVADGYINYVLRDKVIYTSQSPPDWEDGPPLVACATWCSKDAMLTMPEVVKATTTTTTAPPAVMVDWEEVWGVMVEPGNKISNADMYRQGPCWQSGARATDLQNFTDSAGGGFTTFRWTPQVDFMTGKVVGGLCHTDYTHGISPMVYGFGTGPNDKLAIWRFGRNQSTEATWRTGKYLEIRLKDDGNIYFYLEDQIINSTEHHGSAVLVPCATFCGLGTLADAWLVKAGNDPDYAFPDGKIGFPPTTTTSTTTALTTTTSTTLPLQQSLLWDKISDTYEPQVDGDQPGAVKNTDEGCWKGGARAKSNQKIDPDNWDGWTIFEYVALEGKVAGGLCTQVYEKGLDGMKYGVEVFKKDGKKTIRIIENGQVLKNDANDTDVEMISGQEMPSDLDWGIYNKGDTLQVSMNDDGMIEYRSANALIYTSKIPFAAALTPCISFCGKGTAGQLKVRRLQYDDSDDGWDEDVGGAASDLLSAFADAV